MNDPLSLYIHIPFCIHRCSYCDFNTYAGQERHIHAYVEALLKEIKLVAQKMEQPAAVHTIFFGGGTPSILPPESIRSILDVCREHFDVSTQAEISLEANPGTLTPGALRALREAGVNRISLGMQSAQPGELMLLERQHDTFDVLTQSPGRGRPVSITSTWI